MGPLVKLRPLSASEFRALGVGPATFSWLRDRYPATAYLCASIAVSATETCEMLATVPLLSDDWPSTDYREWCRLYYRGSRIRRVISSLSTGQSGVPEDPLAAEFFVAVFWPVVLTTGRRPSELLRRARSGDIEALDPLLRLDKRALSDRRIGIQVARLLTGSREGLRERIRRAIEGRPTGSVKPGAVKAHLAAYLIEVSERVSMETQGASAVLTAPETRSLFDAITRDRTGALRDDDLPLEDFTWAKAIQRARREVRPIVDDSLRRTKVVGQVSE